MFHEKRKSLNIKTKREMELRTSEANLEIFEEGGEVSHICQVTIHYRTTGNWYIGFTDHIERVEILTNSNRITLEGAKEDVEAQCNGEFSEDTEWEIRPLIKVGDSVRHKLVQGPTMKVLKIDGPMVLCEYPNGKKSSSPLFILNPVLS